MKHNIEKETSMISTIQELWAYVLKDIEPKSKEYYKAEYYMGQAVATYGAQHLIDEHNRRQIGV